ncbi:uncharacterized protein BT62DRAFT_1076591 [Guyanagaster necrorhizus]|uniref:Secreted protein n=1 Tax=Guyanagaster necrorhizus TaxID=856835 RepID=A0A9P7VRX7_9AGAR|nr:uncharacterized protein BT62DRAFT_1076591 [Guyanagaster necrorhizus MCA 3950]KAG7445497.1 hypothetical protein BT62DRAFT_1076591 [Guyanagaster necrorhizus MCA 3950]
MGFLCLILRFSVFTAVYYRRLLTIIDITQISSPVCPDREAKIYRVRFDIRETGAFQTVLPTSPPTSASRFPRS